MAQYWVQREGKTTGPFSGQQLKQMAAADMIMMSEMVSADQINWRVAGQVKGLFQTKQPTEDSRTTAEGSRPEPTALDSVPQGSRRTYTCPICTRRFDAVKSGAIGCKTGAPEFKIGLFTGAESTQCPACRRKVMFSMTVIRLCLYVAIGFVSLTPLAFAVVRDARIDLLKPLFVGFFSFVVIRDLAMRRRCWLWFLSGTGVAIVSFALAFVLIPEEWYAPEDRAWFDRQTWDRLDPNKTKDWGVGREVIGIASAVVNPLDTVSAYRKIERQDSARRAESAAILKDLHSMSGEKYTTRAAMEASYVGKADGKLLMSRINPGVPYNEGRSAAVWDNIDNMKPAPNTSITKPPAPAATTAPTPATSIENQHEKEPR